MNVTVIYADKNLDPVGTKNVILDEKIIDKLFENAEIDANIIFDFDFKYSPEISIVINHFKEYETKDNYHLYFNFSVEQFNYENNFIQMSLINNLIQIKKDEIEKLVCAKLDNLATGISSIKDKMGFIYFSDNDAEYPYFGFSKPINKDYTYLQLFELINEIEKLISNILEQTIELTKNITSIQRPN
jgi:hypothetical protein